MRKNRGYERGEPHRDARLFVIACEGAERERRYFKALAGEGSSRLKVRILSPEDTENGDSRQRSAPKWVLDRVVKYLDENSVNVTKGDRVWLVLDIDNWGKALHDLAKECEAKSWGLALSNPCFEVWLILHVTDIQNVTADSCQEFKREIPTKFEGGYKVQVFTLKDFVEKATDRAAAIDLAEGVFPEHKTTKVYQVVRELVEMLGQ